MATIYYFVTPTGEKPVRSFIESLGKQQKSKIFKIFEAIETYGIASVLPHIKKLHKLPLWEIRILGRDNIRILYVVKINDSVILLHGFIKKSQKTSSKEIRIALKRLRLTHDIR